VLCLVFSAAFLSSELYISKETIHHCTGAECPICRILIICHVFLSTLSCGVSITAAVCAIVRARDTFLLHNQNENLLQTPVTLKIKLSN
jgi:uncharacterized membrane protein YozB (DUF420 family)